MDGSYQGAPLWERQPSESREAFAAFKLYRDMPPRDRSVDAAYCAATGHAKGTKKAPGRWKAWSVEGAWVSRADAYDAHLRDLELAAQQQALEAEAAKWAERQAQQREDEWTARTRLLEKINQMLNMPVVEQTVTSPDGRSVTVKPAKWTFSTVAQLLDAMQKLGRLSTEMDSAQQKADVRLQRDFDHALVKLERELPPETFAQVLKALADGDSPEVT